MSNGGGANRLLIMRHAKSDWSDPALADVDRPLNGRGNAAAIRMAAWLADHDLRPDRILCSAATRTRRTVQHLVTGLWLDPATVVHRDDLYLADAESWLAAIRTERHAATLLLCGHNPGCDELLELLSIDEPGRQANGKLLTTAAIADLALEGPWSDVGPGSGRLVQLVRPRELAAEAGG
ncbi:MAG: histidine phosphatase family protein [Actinomycetota bacterium]